MFKVQFIPQLGTARFEPTQGLRGVLLLMRVFFGKWFPMVLASNKYGVLVNVLFDDDDHDDDDDGIELGPIIV